jgi:hypothetical protein
LLHPKRKSSDEASPRTTATLTGEEGTGEGYRLGSVKPPLRRA